MRDGYGDQGVACGAVRLGRRTDRSLRVAGRVGGARLDHVDAWSRVPADRPLTPGVDPGHGGERGVPPRPAVDPHLDRVDAFVLRPRDACDRRGPGLQPSWPGRDVDPGLGLDRRLLAPA